MKKLLGLLTVMACLAIGCSSLEAEEQKSELNFYGGMSTSSLGAIPFSGVKYTKGSQTYEVHLGYRNLHISHYSTLNLAVLVSLEEEADSNIYWGVGVQNDIYFDKTPWNHANFFLYPEVIWGHEKTLFSGHKLFMQIHYHPVELRLRHGFKCIRDGSVILKFGLSI